MKLIIQIPCYNEEEALSETLGDLPRSVPGIDIVEWLIIDDGSSDSTAEVARSCGVDHVVTHPHNLGLAKAFMTGIRSSIELGADVIVNTDADNQYSANCIKDIVKPIVENRAEMVIGARPISEIDHFSGLKKFLQKLGSNAVRLLSRSNVEDAPSGFRAFSRDMAMRLNVFSEYTYTLETIIQSGQNGIRIESVPVKVNGETRPSRLVKNVFSYVKRSLLTMFRIFIIYRPMRFFLTIGSLFFTMGFLIGARFLFYYFIGDGSGKIQSLILAAVLIVASFLMFVVGILGDLLAVNRKLLQDIDYRLKRIENGDWRKKG